MPAKTDEKRVRHAVYFSPPRTADHILLSRVIEKLAENREASDFLRALILRGWVQVLHGLSREERSLQLRALDLSDDLIAEIDAMVPTPAFPTMAQPSTAVSGAVEAQGHAPVPPAAPRRTFEVPKTSAVGVIGAEGGLS